jgi:TetR/AcrR family transcriptional regulator
LIAENDLHVPGAHGALNLQDTYRPRVRVDEVSELQRARLFAALVQVLEESGPGKLTAGRVCRYAKVSKKTFYEHFETAEDCLLIAVQDAVSRVAAVALPAYLARTSWRERIRAGLGAMLVLFDEEPVTARLCVVHALAARPLLLRYREKVLAVLVEVVDAGAERTSQAQPVLAEGLVGAVLSVVHSRLVADSAEPLVTLVNPLMSMIVQPYLGSKAASREMQAPALVATVAIGAGQPSAYDLQSSLDGLKIRLTYRTLRVLRAIAENPGATNREVSDAANIADQGQISKLLGRLHRLELVCNTIEHPRRGAANAWELTPKGTTLARAALASVERQ